MPVPLTPLQKLSNEYHEALADPTGQYVLSLEAAKFPDGYYLVEEDGTKLQGPFLTEQMVYDAMNAIVILKPQR